jgi:hypothetical protein
MVKQYTNLIDKIPHTIRLVFKKYVKILTFILINQNFILALCSSRVPDGGYSWGHVIYAELDVYIFFSIIV